MIKFNSCLALMLLPFTVWCATGDSIKAGDSIKPDKRQVGFVYAPEYAYRTLKSAQDERWITETRDEVEVARFGYSTGINFAYKVTAKCMFEAQALFSDKGETVKNYELGNIAIASYLDRIPDKGALINHYYYLDVPLKLNYYLLNSNVKVYVTGGASVNYFLFQKTITILKFKDGSEEKYTSRSQPAFEKINIALLAGFGINYDLSDKYTLKIEPVFKHAITPVINAPVKTYLYSAGINFGVAYTF